jgi:hypothetical protein
MSSPLDLMFAKESSKCSIVSGTVSGDTSGLKTHSSFSVFPQFHSRKASKTTLSFLIGVKNKVEGTNYKRPGVQ